MTLFVLIGIPGVGKTTFANRLGMKVVSRDDLPYTPNQRNAWLTQLGEVLTNGEDVVADSTGTARGTRMRLLFLARSMGVPCVAVLFTDLVGAWRRNFAREEPIPIEAMDRMHRLYKDAEVTVKEEGFDLILYCGEVPHP